MKLLVNQNGTGRLQNFSSFWSGMSSLAMQDNTCSDSTSLETYFVCFFSHVGISNIRVKVLLVTVEECTQECSNKDSRPTLAYETKVHQQVEIH